MTVLHVHFHFENTSILFIQGDQKVSVHLMITIQPSGAERLFDHPVYNGVSFFFLKCISSFFVIRARSICPQMHRSLLAHCATLVPS